MKLLEKINDRTAIVGVIGLGYVGLPLSLEFALKGFNVIGFDLDGKKIDFLSQGESYIKHISAEKIKLAVASGRFTSTTDFSRLKEPDAIIICVPTPLDEHREPDMSYVVNTAKTVAQYIRPGQLVVLESTTYPGTTEEILLPMFEKQVRRPELEIAGGLEEEVSEKEGEAEASQESAMKVGEDFYLAFSPEREDPNNQNYTTSTIPKVIGGVTPNCLEVAQALYSQVIAKTVPVSSTRVAEAAKLLENIYRSVNIALVNELKLVFGKMNIDVWEVIEAASTKPFGFHPFYPGPGLGGHCIPIDPFYLSWKARENDSNTRFIELAGEINTAMPYYVVEKTFEALNQRQKSMKGSRVLILGAAYKKDIDDTRESPSLKLIDIFREKGAIVDYNDPYMPKLPKTRKYKFDMVSAELTPENLEKFDLVVLSTDHSSYDYELISRKAQLIIDTRNAFGSRGIRNPKIVKA
ncbi:MAG: nucleotide sugar dehydrogenase [Ignavibacteria bacterium]|jgi:UDP-N-acetyl-D-glucosamine dehydrogenase|nr:nucleotide sugar dehydrogenase [Ignavibacteria bacterium]MCU7504419.1 nucleotide sugar dehydrogenase [Ignavibacteria bacterium]MCU7517490.1 nucleotide sugar dehydrogenase [Ignavibacteria bacterium]